MFRRLWFLVAILLLAGLTYGRAHATNAPVVTAAEKEFEITLSTTTVQAGTPVRFQVTNDGKIQHEFVIEKAGAVDQHLTADEEGKEVESEIEAFNPGETKTLEWTFMEPGKYQVACHIPGHYEAGMVAEFTVTPANSTDSSGIESAIIRGINPTTVFPFAFVGGLVGLIGIGIWKFARR
jgi:uncharacterized cupredoxin-like copper-binding protein